MNMTTFNEFDRLLNRLHNSFGRPVWYGYELSVDMDGCPTVCRLGGTAPQEGSSRPIQVESIVDDKRNEIKLVAEIPGVEKKDINVTLEEAGVAIKAIRDKITYEATVPLYNEVDRDSVRASYRNGILEVIFGVSDKPKGTVVRVE